MIAALVPEAIEGSLMLAAHALALVGVPMRRVIRIARDARDKRYGLLRGFFHGADDDLGVDTLLAAEDFNRLVECACHFG